MALQVTDVQKALRGADYPATPEELATLAEDNGADQDIVDAVRDIDADELDGPDQVMAELQGELGDDDE